MCQVSNWPTGCLGLPDTFFFPNLPKNVIKFELVANFKKIRILFSWSLKVVEGWKVTEGNSQSAPKNPLILRTGRPQARGTGWDIRMD